MLHNKQNNQQQMKIGATILDYSQQTRSGREPAGPGNLRCGTLMPAFAFTSLRFIFVLSQFKRKRCDKSSLQTHKIPNFGQ